MITDKYGPWWMLIVSSIVLPLAYISVGPFPLLNIAPSKTQLMIALCFMGLALPMACIPALPAMFSIYRSKNQGQLPKVVSNIIVALYISSYGVGYLIGTSLSGFIAPHASFGWSTGTLGLIYTVQSCACIVFCLHEVILSRGLHAEDEISKSICKEYGTINGSGH